MECAEKISHQIALNNDIMINYSGSVQNVLEYQQFVNTTNCKLMCIIDVLEYHRKKQLRLEEEVCEQIETRSNTKLLKVIFLIILLWCAFRSITTQIGVAYSSNNAGDGPTLFSRPISETTAAALDFGEMSFLLAMGLLRARDKTDYAIAIANYVKMHAKGALITGDNFLSPDCSEAILMNKMMDYMSHLFESEPTELQSSNVFTDILEKLEDFENLKNSELFKRFHKLFMYIISFSLFGDKDMAYDDFGYTSLEVEAIKRTHSSKLGFALTLTKTVTFICSKGYQIYKGEECSIFHSEKRYADWYNEAERLQRMATQADHDPNFKESTFLSELDDTIERGDAILKFGQSMNKYEYDSVRRYCNALKMVKCEHLTRKRARSDRDSPFAILINGETGIGKTYLKNVLRVQYALVNGLSTSSDYCYTRNPAADFWDGFSSCQWALVMDDIAFMNVNIATNGDQSCMEFLQVINPTPFCPNQANLADKGMTPLLCELVIGTTNCKHLNAHFYFNCPSAVLRRFPYIITPSVRPEYRKDGCLSLDYTKVPRNENGEILGTYDDYWTFTIEKVIPVPIKNGTRQSLPKLEIVKKDIGMDEFIDWYNQAIKNHKKDTAVMKEAGESLQKITLCDTCLRPKGSCKCLQSMDVCQRIAFHFLKFWFDFAVGWLTGSFTIYLIYWILDFMNYWPIFQHNMRCYIGRRVLPNILRRAGRQAYESFNPPKMLALIAAGAVVSYKSWQYFSMFQNLQSQDSSDGRKPKPDEGATLTNPWYSDDYQTCILDYGRKVASSKGLDLGKMIEMLSGNCIAIETEIDAATHRPTKGFCIGGQVYIVNSHAIPNSPQLKMKIYQQSSRDGVTTNLEVLLSERDIYRFPDKDLCAIIIRNLPPKKDLSGYFPTPEFRANAHGTAIRRESDGSIVTYNVDNIKLEQNCLIGGLETPTDLWTGFVAQPSKNGDCGTLLLMRSEIGYVLLGFHMSGKGDKVMNLAITTKDIEKIKNFGNDYFVDAIAPILQSGEIEHKLVSLHRKSAVRYIKVGHARVFGSFAGHRAKHKTRVTETLMVESMLMNGYKIKFTQPAFDYRCWRNALLDSLNIPTNIDTQILDDCTDNMIQDVLGSLSSEDLDMLHKYDEFTAVNGAAGVQYVDKIVTNTSSGFPYNKSKRYYLESIPPAHDLDHPVEITKEIRDLMDEMNERLANNQPAAPVFSGHLKDEPVTYAKRDIGKTRVFAGASFPWLIIARIHYLSFIRLMQSNKFTFEGAPGLIAQCSSWEHLYEYLTKFGDDRMVAGDFAKFDKKMSAVFLLAAFRIIISLCKKSGNFTDKDLQIMKCLAYDVAFSYQNFNGDLIQFFGSNPSGHPLTVIINCLVNSLYMRYAYTLANPEKTCKTFKQHVNLMTYGDDNIMGISKDAPWFNHTSISDCLATIGVTYTMADKTAQSIPYINISETSFLKRKFVFDPTLKRVVAPLDEESIERSLTVWVRSKSITEEEQALAVISSAIREYFFHGKEIFEQKRLMFVQTIKELDIERYVTDSTLPSYSELESEYHKRSALADSLRD
jgi:hypothetical protein